VLQTIRIIAVASIGWASGWLWIRRFPWLWSKCPEQGGRVESTGTNFHVIGLLYYTTLFGPIFIQLEYDILKIHRFSSKKLRGRLASVIKGYGIL
jgi:hypothetical protein